MSEPYPRVWKRLPGPGLLVGTGMIAASLLGTVFGLQGSTTLPSEWSTEPSRAVKPDRPFDHADHTAVSCVECHGTGDQHRAPRVWTARTCATCHHDEARAYACDRCHDAGGPPDVRRLPVDMAFSVWESPIQRLLPFRHEVHGSVACRQCHVTPVDLAPLQCTACHEQHHRSEATCSTCHTPSPLAAHDRAAHLTCTGSGCHAAAVLETLGRQAPAAGHPVGLRPPLTRNLCLLCHTEQVNHEPGRSCHGCHAIPEE